MKGPLLLQARNSLLTLVTGLFIAGMQPASAQSPVNTDYWQMQFTPYIFGAGLNGKIRTGNVTTDLDASFEDIAENLDAGLMAVLQAHKGAWTFTLDGVYFEVSDEKPSSWQGPLGSSGTADLEASVTEQVYQLAAGYRILDEKNTIDIVGLVRYTALEADSKLLVTTGTPLLEDGSYSLSENQDWWDPAIGFRLRSQLNKTLTFVGYADIGGFSIGSDLTYQILAGLDWQFADSFIATAGYRYLYQDYSSDEFDWDMAASGAYLGLGLQF